MLPFLGSTCSHFFQGCQIVFYVIFFSIIISIKWAFSRPHASTHTWHGFGHANAHPSLVWLPHAYSWRAGGYVASTKLQVLKQLCPPEETSPPTPIVWFWGDSDSMYMRNYNPSMENASAINLTCWAHLSAEFIERHFPGCHETLHIEKRSLPFWFGKVVEVGASRRKGGWTETALWLPSKEADPRK